MMKVLLNIKKLTGATKKFASWMQASDFELRYNNGNETLQQLYQFGWFMTTSRQVQS